MGSGFRDLGLFIGGLRIFGSLRAYVRFEVLLDLGSFVLGLGVPGVGVCRFRVLASGERVEVWVVLSGRF